MASRALTEKSGGAIPSTFSLFAGRSARTSSSSLCRVDEVPLVDDEHDLLAPVADALEKQPLGLGERAVDRGDEQHQVGARHEVRRERLVLADDGVGARRVDDVDVAEELDGRGDAGASARA